MTFCCGSNCLSPSLMRFIQSDAKYINKTQINEFRLTFEILLEEMYGIIGRPRSLIVPLKAVKDIKKGIQGPIETVRVKVCGGP